MAKSSIAFKSTFILIGVVAILMIIYLAVGRGPKRPPEEYFFPRNVTDTIKIVSQAQNMERVVLSKKGMDWFMEEPVADQAETARIEGVLALAETLTVKGVATNKKTKYDIFQIGDEEATRVQFYGGAEEPICDFYLGKKSKDQEFSYVRLAGEDNVYMLSGTFGFFWRRPTWWREKRLLKLEPWQITNLQIKYLQPREEAKSFSLAFDDEAKKAFIETAAESKEADYTKAGDFRKFVVQLSCTGFKDEEVDYSKARAELILTLKEDSQHKILLKYLPEETAWVARVDEGKKNFGFYQTALDKLWSPADTYLPAPPLSEDEEKLQIIEKAKKKAKQKSIVKKDPNRSRDSRKQTPTQEKSSSVANELEDLKKQGAISDFKVLPKAGDDQDK